MKTIQEQTGWKRIHPLMICQDIDALGRVYDYSYDLDNEKFVKYFKNRTGVCIDETPMDDLKCDVEKTIDFIENSIEFKTIFGEMIDFTERSHFVRTHKILRGKLQDCWELFKTDNRRMNETKTGN